MSTPVEELVRVTDEAPTPSLDPRQAVRDALMATPAPAPAVETPAESPTPEVPAQVETALETPAIVTPEPEPEATRPESHFAPFFEIATLPNDQAIPRAAQQVKEIIAYDGEAADIAATGFWHEYEPSYFQMSLQKRGIPPARVAEFEKWVKDGAQPLLLPTAPQAFPSWDERDIEGYIVLPDGVRLNPENEVSRTLYDNAKYVYESKIEKAQGEALKAKQAEDDARKSEQEQRQATARAEFERVSTFHGDRLDYVESLLDATTLSYSPEESWKEERFVAGVLAAIDNDAEIDRLAKESSRHIKGGTGRTAEYAAAIDRRIRVVVNSMVDRESRERLATTRPAAPTAPVETPGTQRIDVVTSPAPTSAPPKNRDEVFQRGRDAVRNALGARPAQV